MPQGSNNAIKTHCPQGHEYTPENTKRIPSRPNARYCKTCVRADNKARLERKRREAGIEPRVVRDAEYYREYHREYAKTWKPANQEKLAEYSREWRKRNPEYGRRAAKLRRARLAGADTYAISAKDARRLAGPCLYCGGPGESKDHVVPLVRGGSHGIGNLVPCCLSCNRRKNDRTIMEWRVSRERR